MFGGDINASYGRINGIAGFALQSDKKPFLGSTKEGKATHLFAEASYIVYPWLVPVVRFESFAGDKLDSKTGKIEAEDELRILIVPNILLRANVKLMVEVELEKEHGKDLEFMEVAFAIMFGL
jgi:hypothetical protein